ncbi:hypothetical protein PWT90_06970 [Aphanocladium album]|nr:hypothetical protein PWT90_06970 [Aphanocladium album]
MNIRGHTEQSDGILFAPDALRIEISGPTGLHLSVVDLPGLISVTNDEQSEEDVDAVYDMASNDMANQGIIKLARKHDPDGQRTVGIITKPDLINEGAQHRIALVAKNEDSIKLKLGFFLLKNPSPLELEDAKEKDLQALGSARPSVDHVRTFLTGLSMKFFQLMDAALRGNYDSVNPDFFSNNNFCRLRARTQELNTAFATEMRLHGQKRKIDTLSPPSNSDDEATDETTQLIVSGAEMLQWVKESQGWIGIAQNHIDSILKVVLQWVEHATKNVILEDHLRCEVSKVLANTLEEAKESATAELDRLLRDERQSPMTYNHYYTDNVQKARLDEQKAAVRSAIALVTQEDHHGRLHISNHADDIERFITAIQSRITFDMDESACKEALTQLEAYYKKVAMKTFVDNVARQVIERHIMSPLPEAFGPRSVSSLSNEELWRIGSEPQAQSVRRSKLQTEVEDLSKSILDLQAVF